MTLHNFSARLRRPFLNFFDASPHYVAVPESWSDMANGGPDQARIAIKGHADAVGESLRFLGYEAEILSPLGGRVWWGRVTGVEANFGGTEIRMALDDVYNAVAVAYVETAADGSISRQTTDWAEDARSIERYGRREMMLTLSEGNATAAEHYRDRFLAQTKAPVPETTIGGGEVGGMLQCSGYWHELGHRYYTNLKGLEEFTTGGSGVQGTGNFYAGTTISFVAPDKILDSANGLGQLTPETRFLVQIAGEADNVGWHTVESQTHAGEIITVGQGIVTDAAGDPTLIATSSGFSNAVAQAFQLTEAAFSPWIARRVAVQVARVGPVTDNLRVELRANDFDPLLPGDFDKPANTALASGTVAGSTLSEQRRWIEMVLDTPVTLNAATTYWVVVVRSGYWSDHPARLGQHYAVTVNEELGYAGGALLIADDTNWYARVPDAQMPFRVLGRRATTLQMQDIVAASGMAGIDLEIASGIETWEYREGDRTGLDEISDLLDIGTVTGERILARVQPTRHVRVVERAAAERDTMLILAADGTLRSSAGQPLEPGQLVAGNWVELEFLPLLDGMQPRDAIYIERSRYDAASGELSIESEGLDSVWQLGILPG